MREARKLEILNFIDSLNQAHGEIREALEKREVASAQVMLAECQDFAVELGNAIEETEGEGCVTVSHVEKYCETLFRVYDELNGQTQQAASKIICDSNKVYKLLKKQLIKIENSLKNDVKIRKEVVFLPYKASMWDSLESVYLAAKEDPDCDAYCVPIPYFDLNADHSFTKMHYEGDEYPKDLEVVDWKGYNLEERRPDIIFIHNPYDEWNNVTSVHPRYYAKNLKKYTNNLVYIPYFILRDIKKDDPGRDYKVDGIKHFCFTPGTIFADKVIVQSEDMRQIYIEEYLKEAKNMRLPDTRKELEEKILGLGSPKIDKVQRIQKTEFSIPEQWEQVIWKSDGGKKKIVFYNTGISALLVNDEKWINKIENVIEIFKEHKEKVTLLWRPHPLIENTIKSMRQGLLKRFLEIKEDYISGNWGIYDDTPELDRAIAISDVYYGDRSSVVQLYQQTGKPVMIQDVDVIFDTVKAK